MKETEFNLIDEKWIRVLRSDYQTEEVSLLDALLRAHEFIDLNGELKTQDVAVLRLLLAVLHTVFSRVDVDGNEAPFETEDDALLRWKSLWDLGRLPEEPLRAYFREWHERFWLFHPERPFYQVKEAAKRTDRKEPKNAKKLNGEVWQSEHKERLFLPCSDDKKEQMSYAEAARWLLHMNAFDDASIKPSSEMKKGGEKVPSSGLGWLGRLGVITVVGDTLFETLLLNLTFLQDGNGLWEDDNIPCWELDEPRKDERKEVNVPNNQAQLLTLQSRRVILERRENAVVGYRAYSGDFFDEKKENALAEQMTVWTVEDEKGGRRSFLPRRHDASRAIWRDFASIIAKDSSQHQPGIVSWISKLKDSELLGSDYKIRFQIVALQYDSSNSSAKDTYSDEFSFHSRLLADAGDADYCMAVCEINNCEKAAVKIGQLSKNLYFAKGGKMPEKKKQKKVFEQIIAPYRKLFFDRIDAPFRKWLLSLDGTNDVEARRQAQMIWEQQARKIALELGKQMIADTAPAAFTRKVIENNDKEKPNEVKYYAAPDAFNAFLRGLNKIYPKQEI